MRVGVRNSLLLLACGATLVCGCRAGGFSLNPFKRDNPAATAAAPNAPGTSISNPSSGVVPAGFQQQAAAAQSQYPAAPGVSLDDVSTKKSFWESTVTTMKPSNMKKKFMKAIGQGPNEPLAKKYYAEGDEFFRQRDFANAAKKYKAAGKRWPDSTLQEDSLFMLGESQFFDDSYPKASAAYTELLKKYENSRYLDKIMVRDFAIARFWDEESRQGGWNYWPNFRDKTQPGWDTSGNAIALYESIWQNDPSGPLADDALMAVGNAYFLKARYEDADYNYERVRKDHPESEHQAQAHLLGLRAKLASYQGPEYEDSPLFEAEDLVKSTLLQFGSQMPEERERLIQAQKAIRAQQAEREWASGEYYYRRKYYRAAAMYYNTLIKDYPETRLAQLAEDRLIETKDLPPEPHKYFAWLGKIFGERKRN